MYWLRKIVFKFMELGLGLKPYFLLETRKPVFVNFRLTPEEADRVRAALPAGFRLRPIRFAATDAEPAYWLSYNLYDVLYPKKELRDVERVRCEINTFVEDASGRRGVFVFSGSPLVSREPRPSVVGRVCELAERLVLLIYGCGRLVPLVYELTDRRLAIEFAAAGNRFSLRHDLGVSPGAGSERLSDDYLAYNDVSFFNHGRTFDLVSVNSAFTAARFEALDGSRLDEVAVESPFLKRAPDRVYYHRGAISYLVSALNRA